MESDSQHIRVCALVLSVASFFLFIAAETLQYEGQRAHRVVLTLVALGTLGFAWIGPLTLLAGSLHSPKFKWWQPFEGGVEFVWMQAFGWSLDALVLTASVVVLANFRVHEWFQGLYLLLGVTGFCAQILLNLSISSFVEQDTGQPVFQFRLNTKAVVSLLISASGTLMFMIYDACSHLMQSSVIVTLACSQFVISAVIIHVIYGCLEIPGYRFWQPFEGDRMFLLLQYLGWQFFACVVAGSIILCVDPESSRLDSRAYSVGTATALGMTGFISQVLLLTSLQFFVRENSACEMSRQVAADAPAQGRQRRSPEVLVAALLSVSALLVGLLSHAFRTVEWVSLYPAVQVFRHHERVWWGISMCALVMATPIAQMGAVRTDHSFRWWQPFAGGTRFIFLQMIGWFWYGIFLALVVVLWMNRRFIGEPLSLCVLVLGAASAFTIAISLPYFTTPGHSMSDSKSKLEKSFAARSDVAMFLIFALTCAFFHVMVDVFHERMATVVRVLCVALGTGSSVLGCGIAQMSGCRYFSSYRFWQPFEGGTRYVIRQAVGWTLFAVQLLFDSLLLSIIAWQRAPAGVPSLIGLFSLMPHFLIVSSITCFRSGTPSRDSGKLLYTPTTAGWNELWREAPIQWRVIVNLVVAVGSMGLFIGAEVVHGSDRVQCAEEVLYLFGFLSSVCGMSLGHCVLGPKMHATYRLFQPFRGGTRFITLQGAAWTLMSMGWAVACTVLFWSEEFFRVKGIHVMTGLLFFVAQLVLLYSLPLFTPRTMSGTTGDNKCGQTGFRSQAEDWINQFLVGPLLGIAACSVFVIVDLGMVYFGPSIPVFPVTLCAVLALFTSIPMSYSMASSRFGTRAKVFSGSIVFVVAGCALWSFTLLLAVVFSYNLWALESGITTTVNASKSPTAFMGTFTGTIGFVAQLLLLQAPGSRHSRSADGGLWGSLEKPMLLIKWVEHRAGSVAVWVYSFGAVVAWALYCYLRAMVPRHLAATQVFSLFACTAVVIVSAWWIQHHILSSGSSGFNDVYSKKALVSPLPRPSDEHPALRLGVDCYLHLALLLSASDVVALSKSCRRLRSLFSESFWRDVFHRRLLHQGKLTSHHATVMEAWESAHYSSFNLRTPLSHTTLTRIEDVIFTAICRLELPRWKSFTQEIPGIRYVVRCSSPSCVPLF